MKYKHAQIRIMETIAILLIFFVLIVLGFVFFIRTASFTQEGKITKDQELQSIRVSQAISFLPELQCSSKNIPTDNCFDKYKLNAFKEIIVKDAYYSIFYYSEIKVEELETGTIWDLYNRKKNTSSYTTVIPILLENASSKINSFGLLNVTYYTIN